jgi:cytochrome c-type biogenesis protein CcmH
MTLFWLLGAALAAGVLAMLLRPLLRNRSEQRVSRRDANVSIYRDQLRELDADLRAGLITQADYERARRELEARALEDASVEAPPQALRAASGGRRAAWAIGAGIPVLALGLYLAVGNPDAFNPAADPHAITAQQLEGMVERLAAKLRESPEDAEGWRLLGRSYAVLGRFAESAEAYAKAAARSPNDAQLLVDFADALAMARGQRLDGEPEKLIARALELDPANLKGLALAGTAAYARKDYRKAAAFWEKMLPLVPPDSEDARAIRANVEEARSLAATAPAKGGVQGMVTLSPKVKAQAGAEDTVFIFARAVEGPPMPLAVKRVRVRDLPAAFQLDDSMAMAPGMNVSAHKRVVVVARVSRSGSPAAQPGDLQGTSAPVANDAQGVSVTIDSVVR